MPKSMDDYLQDWKHTASEVDKVEREFDFMLRKLLRKLHDVEEELNECDNRLGDALKAMDTLVNELARNKLMTFLIMKHPEVVKQLLHAGFQESVLEERVKDQV